MRGHGCEGIKAEGKLGEFKAGMISLRGAGHFEAVQVEPLKFSGQ
jgi:hypothetical protein